MAFILFSFDTDNFDEWKELFDSDPVGRKAVAKGHVILRSADNPNQIFLRTEYPTVDDAKTFRDRLLASGVLDRFPPAFPPTVAELVEEVTY
jgi:hypothetical protein